MLVFAGSRCYKSQVTAAGPHPREPQGAIVHRAPEGRRNAGEEEVIEEGDSQAEHGEAGWRQEVDHEADDGQAEHGEAGWRQEVDREADDGQAEHGEGTDRRGPPGEEEGGSQAGGTASGPARCPKAVDYLDRWPPGGPAGRTAADALPPRGWAAGPGGRPGPDPPAWRRGAGQD